MDILFAVSGVALNCIAQGCCWYSFFKMCGCVEERDHEVIELNKMAAESLPNCRLTIVPGATHLFEEPGALEEVTRLAIDWFNNHVPKSIYHNIHH